MKFKYVALAAVCGVMMLGSCSSKKELPPSYAYMTFDTTCMSLELDGTQTCRAWGKGHSDADAIEQAKKNAVHDVLFKGVQGCGSTPESRPIVTEVNARTRYAEYFNRFFADGGEYRKFVKEDTKSNKTRMKANASSQKNLGVVVTVNRPALRAQLVNDGVLAQ